MTSETPAIPPGAQRLAEMPRRIPVNGTFELTVRCNLHCKMCLFRHADSENARLLAEEMTADEWIEMARQAARAGTVNLLITGGEPLLRPDFCEIWEGVYQQGFLITLYTNATLVTPKVMETLRRYPPHKIGVTIYGASPETYRKVCGDAAAFARTIAGIHQLQTLPSVLEFRTTIIKDNYADADAIDELVQREFGKEFRVTQARMVTKAVRGACADVESCRLDPEDNVRLAFRRGINLIKQYVGDRYDERILLLEHVNVSEDDAFQPRLTLFGCDAGMRDYVISWDGQLLGCQMLGVFHTDARGQGFHTAWERFPLEVKLPPVNNTCLSCKSRNICNCCYASRYAETGFLDGLPDYVCKDTSILQAMYDRGESKHGKNEL